MKENSSAGKCSRMYLTKNVSVSFGRRRIALSIDVRRKVVEAAVATAATSVVVVPEISVSWINSDVQPNQCCGQRRHYIVESIWEDTLAHNHNETIALFDFSLNVNDRMCATHPTYFIVSVNVSLVTVVHSNECVMSWILYGCLLVFFSLPFIKNCFSSLS